MDLPEMTQLLNNLKADYKVYSRKDIIDSKNNDTMLVVDHGGDISTIIFYDMDCNYIRTL